MQFQENYTKPPSGWVGFLVGVAILGISVLIAIWISYSLHNLDHKKAWPFFIVFPIGFYGGIVCGCTLNENRRKKFAEANNLTVDYRANVFGNGSFFVGYRDKKGNLTSGFPADS